MEQPLDRFRSSTFGWLRGTTPGWATILLFLAGFVLTGIGDWGQWPLLLPAVSLLILGWKWFENMASRFDIYEDRLIVRRGIVMKSLDEVELYRVKDIRLDFSLANQIAGIGTITVTSSDETTRGDPLKLPHVERAQHRREELRRLVEAARQKRRVREVDMIHDDF